MFFHVSWVSQDMRSCNVRSRAAQHVKMFPNLWCLKSLLGVHTASSDFEIILCLYITKSPVSYVLKTQIFRRFLILIPCCRKLRGSVKLNWFQGSGPSRGLESLLQFIVKTFIINGTREGVICLAASVSLFPNTRFRYQFFSKFW